MRFARPLHEILAEDPEWQDREDRQHLAHERWAKDHWETFAFVGHCVRTGHGQIDWDRVMVSRRNWPMLYSAKRRPPLGTEDAAEKYGLRVKSLDHPGEYEVLKGLCQADAIMDMVDEGLVTITMPPTSSTGNSYMRPDRHALNEPSPREPVTGHTEWLLMPWARFGLTDRGWTVDMELAKHRDAGGRYASFCMPEEKEST